MLESGVSKTIRHVCNMLFESFTYGQDNWCTFSKDILTETNNIDIWNEQCISNAQITEIKNKLHETFIMRLYQQYRAEYTMNDVDNVCKDLYVRKASRWC